MPDDHEHDGEGTRAEAAASSSDDEKRWMSITCPACGARLHPVDLGSGAVVLRCPRCDQVVI